MTYSVEYWTETGARQREGEGEMIAADTRLAVKVFPAAPGASLAWDNTIRDFVAPVVAPRARAALSRIVFLRDRLGLVTLATVLAREATDPTIAAFRLLVVVADSIDVGDPVTVAGVTYLRDQKIITDADLARILAPVEG